MVRVKNPHRFQTVWEEPDNCKIPPSYPYDTLSFDVIPISNASQSLQPRNSRLLVAKKVY
ncbi:MAG: hypothetical protein FJ358_03935 [Thaumarchaeota archaeon]|nr:hypothetical protein [Nitrososphaerota archaeon]